jgi:hypothetical protein
MPDRNIDLSSLPEDKLLDLRICDLPLSIEGSWLRSCVKELYRELEDKGIRFKPVCYLADEWLAPDGEPVVGIPFFLAHPALIKLEKKMMLDVEGGTRTWCMKLLRHETGHALNYAYKLYRRRRWQKIFGKFSREYNDTYRFRPYSKSFVRHLEDYYAQYHPDEDFAETFAVWLTPNVDWQNQYKGWKAVTKLKYVEALMKEIREKAPVVSKGVKYWQAKGVRSTLKNYYRRKRHFYAENFPDFHDSNLKKIFALPEDKKRRRSKKSLPLAADIIKKYKKDITDIVARWTGERKYIIADLMDTIAERCRSLRLRTDAAESLVMLKVSTYVTTLVMNYLHTGRFGRRDA